MRVECISQPGSLSRDGLDVDIHARAQRVLCTRGRTQSLECPTYALVEIPANLGETVRGSIKFRECGRLAAVPPLHVRGDFVLQECHPLTSLPTQLMSSALSGELDGIEKAKTRPAAGQSSQKAPKIPRVAELDEKRATSIGDLPAHLMPMMLGFTGERPVYDVVRVLRPIGHGYELEVVRAFFDQASALRCAIDMTLLSAYAKEDPEASPDAPEVCIRQLALLGDPSASAEAGRSLEVRHEFVSMRARVLRATGIDPTSLQFDGPLLPRAYMDGMRLEKSDWLQYSLTKEIGHGEPSFPAREYTMEEDWDHYFWAQRRDEQIKPGAAYGRTPQDIKAWSGSSYI